MRVQQANLAKVCHRLNDAAIIDSNNKLDLLGRLREEKERDNKKNRRLWPAHPTAGCRSLVEHLCKHKTSSPALDGLQQNVSSEQALNQLCLALGGPLR